MRLVIKKLAVAAGIALLAMPAVGNSAPAPGARAAQPMSPTDDALASTAEAMGLLRGIERALNLVTIFEYTATGVMIDPEKPTAPPSKVTRVTIDYDLLEPAIRVDADRAGKRTITVASGTHTWNESIPGAYSGPTPAPAADMMAMLWLQPQGLVLAASVYRDKVELIKEGAATGLAVPVPGVPGGKIQAFLDKDKRVSRVVLTIGADTWQANYSLYKHDFQDYLVWFPTRMIQQKNGKVIADLTLEPTKIWANPYVLFRVPRQVVAAQ
jgi:hypothetical protein